MTKPLSYRERQRIQAAAEFAELAESRGARVLGEYKTAHTKIEMVCKEGHEFSIRPNDYKRGRDCAKCSGHCPKQAEADFRSEAESRGARVVGEYKRRDVKVEMVCKEGHEFSIAPAEYKRARNSGCRACEGKCPAQSEADFRSEAKSRGARVLGGYINNSTKVSMICKEGHEFSVSPNHYKRGTDCPKCGDRCPEQAEAEFRSEVASRNAVVVGEYKRNDTKVDMICKEGHEFSMTPKSYKSGTDCPKCSGNCPIQATAELAEVAESRGARVLGEYKTAHTKIEMVCKEGHEFSIAPSSYKSGTDCPTCSNRFKKYEEHTANTLTQLSVEFKREFRVDTAKTFRRIDFVLPSHEIFIEVDEKHHGSQVVEDIEREDNILKALSNTMYKNFTFERVAATQGKTQEERFDYIEKRIQEIIQKHA